jgi:uncharacterized protein YegP (UPF0339 family)
MHARIFQSADGQWHWHFKTKGRITADSESFPSKSNAVRAAKSVVKAVLKPLSVVVQPVFTERVDEKDGGFKITWE